MKFILYMIICSALYGECLPAHRMVTTYNTHYDCMMAGYEEASLKMKEMGRQDVNKHQIYIKFTCTPVDAV